MGTSTPNIRSQAWSSYWSRGSLHSCVDSFGGQYSGAIESFWRSCFELLQANNRVLDLATGNGALPLLLWEQTRGQAVRTDAVDLAEIAPAWYSSSSHPTINFHPGISMERLPFPEATFDLIVSQFGLEYAQWPQALHECVRVIKPHGRAAFIMHHAESVLVEVGRTESINQMLLLAENGLLDAASRVIPWVSRARSAAFGAYENALAHECRLAYNLAMSRLADEIKKSPVPDLLIESRELIHDLVSGARMADSDRQLSLLSDYRKSLQEASLRTSEMVEHALDHYRMHRFVDVFLKQLPSHSAHFQPIVQEQGILGWSVVIAPTSD